MRTPLLLALVALSPLAAAQFSSVQYTEPILSSQGSVSGSVFSKLTQVPMSSGSAYGDSMRNDFTFLADKKDGVIFLIAGLRMLLTTGDEPVLISDFTLNLNARLINSGGNSALPVTSLFYHASLDEYTLGGNVYTLSDTLANLTGNAYRDVDQTLKASSPYILRPRTVYSLTLDMRVQSTISGITQNTPSVGFTLESGANSPFRGLTGTFNAKPLPEPGPIAALGLGVLPLLRRRHALRRKASNGR